MEIRFITPRYADRFTIPSGDKICIIRGGGREEHTCRYIDDTHMEMDGTTYDIWQFAGMMERDGCEVIPLRSSLPDKCFSVDPSVSRIVVIEKGYPGCMTARIKAVEQDPRAGADRLNESMGVTRAQEAAMIAGSIYGWCKPAADPKNYDADGKLLKSQCRDRGDAR